MKGKNIREKLGFKKDDIKTESTGEGADRRIKIIPATEEGFFPESDESEEESEE